MPTPAHIVVVFEENHSFSDIYGNAKANFINELAKEGLVYTNYHAVTHPSQGNYLALFAGYTFSVNDGNYFFTDPTIASSLDFRGYAEADSPRKHNPWESFADSQNVGRIFPDEFHLDFDNLHQLSYVSPNEAHDMHSGSIGEADSWLRDNLGSYIDWAKHHNSLLVLTFDEDDNSSDNHVPTLVVGQGVTPGIDNNYYDHYDLLKTFEDIYGAPELGHSAERGGMNFYLTPKPSFAFITPNPTQDMIAVDPIHGSVL